MNVQLAIIHTDRDNYELAVESDGMWLVLEYYDSLEEGVCASEKFIRCCVAADDEGFFLAPGLFTHDNGCSVTMAEAIAPEVTVLQFKVELRRLKGIPYPLNLNGGQY